MRNLRGGMAIGAAIFAINAGLLAVVVSREASSAAVTAPPKTRGNCGMCHAPTGKEWMTTPHAKAFTSVTFQTEAKKVAKYESECYPCHAPEQLRVKGYGKTPALRADTRDAGIDCLSCHTDPTGKIVFAPEKAAAPHPLEVDPAIKTNAVCASCHIFGTMDEYAKSGVEKKGIACNTCHMTPVIRKTMASKERKGFSHSFRSMDDPKLAKEGIKLESSVSPDGVVSAKITNNAAHRYPTGKPFHQVLVVVTVTDDAGKEIATAQEVFADNTAAGGQDTRLNSGETRSVELPTGQKAGAFAVKLLYKKHPQVDPKEVLTIATNNHKL